MVRGLLRFVAASVLTLPVNPAVAVPPAEVRILIVGDSTTQGSTGDWTWRYRLWNHLQASGVPADFVGPRRDVFDVRADSFGATDYADPTFDADHAAVWGAALNAYPYSMGDLVAEYRPDVVLMLLGVNDLMWQSRSPQATIESLTEYVQQARASDPGVDVILAELPWVWIPGVDQANELQRQLAVDLDMAQSRVMSASVEGLTQGVDTYDKVHLSASGETKVAAAMADALAALSVGRAFPRPLPQVPNVPVQPATLEATAQEQQVLLTWSRPPGASHYRVYMRDVTGQGSWSEQSDVDGHEWTIVPGLRSDHEYAFRVRCGKGTVLADQLSNTTIAVPHPPALSLTATNHGAVVSWSPVVGATSYLVSWNGRLRRIPGTVIELQRLRAGRSYQVSVTAKPSGRPVMSGYVIPSGPRPPAPTRLRVRGTQVSWRPAPKATRYEILVRRNHSWNHVFWTHRPGFTAGRGRYRVQSWHQDLPGRWATVEILAARDVRASCPGTTCQPRTSGSPPH